MFYIPWTSEINLYFPRNTVFVITITVVLLLFFDQLKPQVPEALQLPHSPLGTLLPCERGQAILLGRPSPRITPGPIAVSGSQHIKWQFLLR